jgi:hypothetical protein
VAGFPLAVSVQKTFARAWRVPMLGWRASYLRGGLWFLLDVATQTGVEAATWTLGRNLGFGVLAGLAGVVLTFLLWLATPICCSARTWGAGAAWSPPRSPAPGDGGVAVAGLSIPLGAWSLVVRFRRAGGVERQQLRWLLVAAAVTVLAVQALTGNQVDLGWLVGSVWRSCPLGSGRRSCAIGCMTWTASSAAP